MPQNNVHFSPTQEITDFVSNFVNNAKRKLEKNDKRRQSLNKLKELFIGYIKTINTANEFPSFNNIKNKKDTTKTIREDARVEFFCYLVKNLTTGVFELPEKSSYEKPNYGQLGWPLQENAPSFQHWLEFIRKVVALLKAHNSELNYEAWVGASSPAASLLDNPPVEEKEVDNKIDEEIQEESELEKKRKEFLSEALSAKKYLESLNNVQQGEAISSFLTRLKEQVDLVENTHPNWLSMSLETAYKILEEILEAEPKLYTSSEVEDLKTTLATAKEANSKLLATNQSLQNTIETQTKKLRDLEAAKQIAVQQACQKTAQRALELAPFTAHVEKIKAEVQKLKPESLGKKEGDELVSELNTAIQTYVSNSTISFQMLQLNCATALNAPRENLYKRSPLLWQMAKEALAIIGTLIVGYAGMLAYKGYQTYQASKGKGQRPKHLTMFCYDSEAKKLGDDMKKICGVGG